MALLQIDRAAAHHDPGVLTCVVTVNGAAQVEARGQVIVLEAGETTYILPNQPPRAPFCADLTEVRDWLYQMRGTEPASDLGSLSVKWLQKPCATPTGALAATSSTALPSSTVAPTASAAAAAQTFSILPTATAVQTVPTLPAAPTTGAAISTAVSGSASAAPTATLVMPTLTPTLAAAAPVPPAEGMVQIPSGHYVVGSSVPDDSHGPAHAIDLAPFWIDKHAVTNAQCKAFLNATGRPAPASWRAGKFATGQDQHPAVGLTWDDAAAYCAWTDKRLPSEAEWEVAGRGPGPTPPLYPWDSDPTAGGKTNDLPQSETYPVGSTALNRSPFEVYDMTGSVWQWVGETYAPAPDGYKILRGGRHGLLEDTAFRKPAQPGDERFAHVAGARCATDKVAGG